VYAALRCGLLATCARGLTTPAKQPLDMKELQANGEWVLIHFWDRYFAPLEPATRERVREGRLRGVVTQNRSRSMRQDSAEVVSDFADTRVQYFHGKPADLAGCENDARVLR